jgi:hypothetical protein
LVPGSEYVGVDAYRRPKYEIPNVGPIAGIGKSFKNPNSIMYSGALEYSYDNAFSRGGYFHESEEQEQDNSLLPVSD